jgi:hypothetical protein
MKNKNTKNFLELVKTRLNTEEIAEIEKQAQLEAKILLSMQQMITSSLEEYMLMHNVGFNELVKRLDSSPSHLAKIRKGQANLTLTSFAHLMATLGQDPQIHLKSKK